jgi:hypothetical protein
MGITLICIVPNQKSRYGWGSNVPISLAGSQSFKGQIDEFSMYNYVLSDSQVCHCSVSFAFVVLSFVVCLLPFAFVCVVCRLSFAVCRLSFVLCPLSCVFVVCLRRLSFAVLPFVFCRLSLKFAVCRLPLVLSP